MSNNYGNIQIKRDSDAAKLIVQIGSKNKSESLAAQETFAAFIGPVIQEVLDQAPVLGNLYGTDTFDEGTAPSVPLDPYRDVNDPAAIQVWSQNLPGGLATSEVKGLDELFLSVFELDSAVSWQKKYAREARVNVVANHMNAMAQGVLYKQEVNAANILLKAISDATYDVNGTATRQVLRAATAGTFSMDDINRLFTLAARTKPARFGGTPVNGSQSLTHLGVSPEMIEQIRSIAYQPVNTRSGKVDTSGATSLAAPDSVRSAVWNLAGTPSFFGIELVVMNELGKDRLYNKIFAKYAGSTSYAGSSFSQSTEQIILALNLGGTNPLLKLQERGADGNTFSLNPDDQWTSRSDKVGFYGKVREGRAVLDSRGLMGLIS